MAKLPPPTFTAKIMLTYYLNHVMLTNLKTQIEHGRVAMASFVMFLGNKKVTWKFIYSSCHCL